jgi:TolB-like protein
MSLIQELKRRNVFRVGVAYVVTAWLVIQVVETLFPVFDFGNQSIRVVIIILAIGLIPVVLFSWAFELTPEGLKREKDVDRDRSMTHQTGKRLDRWVIVILAISLTFFAFDKFVLDPVRDAELVNKTIEGTKQDALKDKQDNSVAVLPFANMSGDVANEYFSDGIAEEILNELAQIPRLQVTARSSSFSFRNSDLPLSEVADRLAVTSILEGSVRRDNDRIRISVQLIDAENDVMLWSETYDHTFDNLFAVQEEIALSVANSLKISLDIEETETFQTQHRLAPRKQEAHAAYLRGRYLLAQRTGRALGNAVEAFEQALAIEPDYAEAKAQLAITYLLLSRNTYGDLTQAEALSHATPHAEEAMRLAPGNAESHAASGMVYWRLGQSKLAEKHFLEALRINPNFAIVHHWLSMLQQRDLGKHEASMESSNLARRLDPVSIPVLSLRITMLAARGLFDLATKELESLKSISPATYHRARAGYEWFHGAWGNVVLGNLDALMVDPEATRAIFPIKASLVWLGLESEVLSFGPVKRVSILRMLGRTEEAVRRAEENMLEDTQSVQAHQSLARALYTHGELQRAAQVLERLWEKSEGRVALITPHFFSLRDILALYEARTLAGDLPGSAELLRAIHTEVENARGAGIKVTGTLRSLDYSEGIAMYLGGRKAEGLRLIRKAVEDGYYIKGRDQGFYSGDLFEDPGFGAILEIHRANLARERTRLLAVVCYDNPYESLWRPSGETCAEVK